MNQKDFSGLVKSLLKGDNLDSQKFWQSLEQAQSDSQAYNYCLSIFQSLANLNKSNFIYQNEEKLYCTLLALEYYKNRKPKSQDIIKQCRKFIQKGKIVGNPKWILQLFMAPLKDHNFVQNFMARLVYIPKELSWQNSILVQLQKEMKQAEFDFRRTQANLKKQNYYSRIKKYSFPQIIGIQTKGISLAYTCFLDYVSGNFNQIRDEQYQYMINCLKILIQSLKVNTTAIDYLCVFIHFIINCITFYSCQSQSVLKQLFMLANQLKNCWGIVGQMGLQLFELLYKQLKIPGHAFRKKLRFDFPSLDIKQSNYIHRQFFIVTDDEDSFSCFEDVTLHNLRKLMIWHIMKMSGFETEQMDEYFQVIRGAAHDSTYQLYFKCMKIVDISANLQVYDKIRNVIKSHLLQLLRQTKTKFDQQGKRAQKNESKQFQQLTKQQNAYNIFRYPIYNVTHLPLVDFTNSKADLSFYSIIKDSRAQNSNLVFYMNKISIIFYGRSSDFVYMIQVLSNFLEEADIQQTRQLQVYYVPKPQPASVSEVGHYIASKDLWYRRFVYNIFKQKVIFPHLELNSQNKKLLPSYFMNKSLHMYLRQAKRVFNLRVYKCILKIKDQQQLSIIYFTSSLLLGTFAQAQVIRINKLKHQQKINKYQNRCPIEIIKQKLSKKPRLIADIGLEFIEPLTNEVSQKKQSNLVFQDLQICNLPRQYFFGDKPDPSGHNLKLAILTQANSKAFWKEFFNQQNFRQNKSTEQLCHAFKQLFISYSVKSMTIKNKNQQGYLRVVVDGVIFQNVQKIIIQSPISTYGLPLSIPILTFLPFK